MFSKSKLSPGSAVGSTAAAGGALEGFSSVTAAGCCPDELEGVAEPPQAVSREAAAKDAAIT
jgi:hypothetical protein